MIYAGYAKSGKEFEVEAAVQDLGYAAWVARRMDFKRTGKRRRPEPVVSPYLPNYVFLDLDPAGFYAVRKVKHLSPTLFAIPAKSERYLNSFRAEIDAAFAAQDAIAQSGERLEQFKPGAKLVVIAGPFLDQLVTFRRTVELADRFPMLVAEGQMFGRHTSLVLDPLHVRAAE